jgi:hypothetical protein
LDTSYFIVKLQFNETQVSEAQQAETCWTNYPAVGGTKTHGYNTPQLAAESVSKACFGVHTRDFSLIILLDNFAEIFNHPVKPHG